jgi:hypothetical protein
MKNEGADKQLLHADRIDDEAADNDGQRKTPKGRRRNGTELGSIQMILLSLHFQDAGPNAKREGGHKQRQATGRKKLIRLDFTHGKNLLFFAPADIGRM